MSFTARSPSSRKGRPCPSSWIVTATEAAPACPLNAAAVTPRVSPGWAQGRSSNSRTAGEVPEAARVPGPSSRSSGLGRT